jgi:hypothetical protein
MSRTMTAIGLAGMLGFTSSMAVAQITTLPLPNGVVVPDPASVVNAANAAAATAANAAATSEHQDLMVPASRIEAVPVPTNKPRLSMVTPSGSVAHIMPTDQLRAQMNAAANTAPDTGPLLYHNGGLIMPQLFLFEIYWNPGKLQTGAATGFSPKYVNVTLAHAAFYNGHGLGNTNTQYFQMTPNANGGTDVVYPSNQGQLLGAVLDQNPYPASGCNDPATPGNCLTDAQIQAEIVRIIQFEKWPVGQNVIYVIYTSAGEGSCMAANSPTSDCAAPGGYCAYHSFIKPTSGLPSDAVIYANMVYPPARGCFGTGTSPNSDLDGDTAASITSHEISESATDPFLNAWFTAQGNENGDLCNQNFGVNTYAGGLANQSWSGANFELQQEFDNHSGQCVQIGPLYVLVGSSQTATR